MQSGVKHLVREALTWGLLAVAGVVAFIYFDDVTARLAPEIAAIQGEPKRASDSNSGWERVVRLKADGRGHFQVEAHINDRPVALVADTGATHVVLTYEDARQAGILPGSLDFTHRSQTANGIAKVAPVVLDSVRVGDIELRDVRAVVSEPGKLHVSLLGMSFLGALTRFEMQGRDLILVQ